MNSKQTSKTTGLTPYNQCVKDTYFKLLKLTTQLLATIERHELRCTYQREDRFAIGIGSKVHEIVSPVIYLSLEYNQSELLQIHFGFEQFESENEYSKLTSKFIRMLYKLTETTSASMDIESSIFTAYVITACSELYEMIEDNPKHHLFKLIPYKPTKKKQQLRVA